MEKLIKERYMQLYWLLKC